MARKILIVDDSIDLLVAMEKLLALYGHEVRTAANAEDAISVAKAFKPEFVLLDIGLPGGKDGYQVAREFREDPDLKGMVLVALTGFSQDEDRERSKEAGFNHHFVKPVDMAELKKLLE